MIAEQKLAQKRFTLLQLAEQPGNISKACRMHKISSSQFYVYKRACQEHGLDSLVDNPLLWNHTRTNCQRRRTTGSLVFR